MKFPSAGHRRRVRLGNINLMPCCDTSYSFLFNSKPTLTYFAQDHLTCPIHLAYFSFWNVTRCAAGHRPDSLGSVNNTIHRCQKTEKYSVQCFLITEFKLFPQGMWNWKQNTSSHPILYFCVNMIFLF